jgi:hypothetical protein
MKIVDMVVDVNAIVIVKADIKLRKEEEDIAMMILTNAAVLLKHQNHGSIQTSVVHEMKSRLWYRQLLGLCTRNRSCELRQRTTDRSKRLDGIG